MAIDDDLAGSLPSPPPPRPDRREAAVAAAIRRFDGVDAPRSRAAEPVGWWARLDRPSVGALVAAGLVLSIGLPVWIASDHGPPADTAEQRAERRAAPDGNMPRVRPRPDTVDAAVTPLPATPPPATEPPRTAAAASPSASARAEPERRAAQQSESVAAFAPPPPPAMTVAPPSLVSVPAPAPATPTEASDSANVVVTGSRMSRESDFAARPQGSAARMAVVPHGSDFCTVADPRGDLDRCRATIAAAVPKRAVPAVRDGLSLAWRGDLDKALAAFDRAVKSAPRSAFAYRNRGQLHRRMGEIARAHADEERAAALDAH